MVGIFWSMLTGKGTKQPLGFYILIDQGVKEPGLGFSDSNQTEELDNVQREFGAPPGGHGIKKKNSRMGWWRGKNQS